MSTFVRWWKFNMVGAMGMVVQLSALALLNWWLRGHYMVASAIAVELTLLHNFIWHLHYTWRDLPRPSTAVTQLVRFHVSNGTVSMFGNLILMKLLVHQAHTPVLVANGIAILCCSVLNFSLSSLWVFATVNKPRQRAAAC